MGLRNTVSGGLSLVHSASASGSPALRPKVVYLIGARSHVPRLAPVMAALERRGIFHQVLVDADDHAGGYIWPTVTADFDLEPPDHEIHSGEGTETQRTARLLTACEEVLIKERPDLVVVVGDHMSSLACSLVAGKLGVPIAHIESGLRVWDWSLSDEINRTLTDRLSDTLFTHSTGAAANLTAEGVVDGRVHAVGNTLVDALRQALSRGRRRTPWQAFGVEAHDYVLVALNRSANVRDNPKRLREIAAAIRSLAAETPVILSLKPDAHAGIHRSEIVSDLVAAGVHMVEPMGYTDFVALEAGAGAIVTDSGSVQEEASALGVSCFTLRETSERPITLTHGTNVLLGEDPAEIAAVRPSQRPPTPAAIPLWDGHAGERVADVLVANYALLSTAT